MVILNVKVSNFCSYKHLEFDFSNLGLALISGQAKAGKSTIMDMPPWILYGITSKDSKVDDVKSWFSEGDVTEGTCEVSPEVGGKIIVTRKRGKASQNDLYWTEEGSPGVPVRGKDMTETQRMLEQRLGVSSDLFITGSYIHQFSEADKFFVAKPKDRREVTEKLVDMSMPVMLGERASEARKVMKKELEKAEAELQKLQGKLESAMDTGHDIESQRVRYGIAILQKINDLHQKANHFDEDKEAKLAVLVEELEALDVKIKDPASFEKRYEQIRTQLSAMESVKKELRVAERRLAEVSANGKAIDREIQKLNKFDGDTCPTCLGPVNNKNRAGHLKELEKSLHDFLSQQVGAQKEVDRLETALEAQPKLEKAYDELRTEQNANQRLIEQFEDKRLKAISLREQRNIYQDQWKEALEASNPFDAQAERQAKIIQELQTQIELSGKAITDLQRKVNSLTWLYDKSFELRGALLEQAVRRINDTANRYLERFFDGDLRIRLVLTGADKLDVEIQNGGYACPYGQLSGSERTMLKLTFSLAMMKQAEEVSTTKFGMIMLDEPLNWLDAPLKIKAFNLLQSLENDYGTILLIDHHEEFKNLFSNRFQIVKNGNYSEVVTLGDAEDAA